MTPLLSEAVKLDETIDDTDAGGTREICNETTALVTFICFRTRWKLKKVSARKTDDQSLGSGNKNTLYSIHDVSEKDRGIQSDRQELNRRQQGIASESNDSKPENVHEGCSKYYL